MNMMRNRWRAIPQICVKLGGGFVLVTAVVAGVPVLGEGRSEKLKDWPHKEVISPKPDVSAPEPMNKSVEISYRCGRDGRSCDVQEFMRRNMVCDILVIRGSELYAHVDFPDENRDICRPVKEQDERSESVRTRDEDKVLRHGVASITKSVTSMLFGWANSDPEFGPSVSLESKVQDALQASVPYPDEAATIRDLLQMSSGMRYNPHREFRTVRVEKDTPGCAEPPDGPDCTLRGKARAFLKDARFETRRPRSDGSLEQPDYFYSDFDSTLLGILVEDRFRAAQDGPGPKFSRLAEAVEYFFWKALPVSRAAKWKADYEHHSPGYCCLKVAPRDLATLGLWVKDLYRGEPSDIVDTWAKNVGKEHVPRMRDWLHQSVSDRRERINSCQFGPYKRDIDYGYQWWIPTPETAGGPPGADGFLGIGIRGQYLHVFPEQDVVVVQLSRWPFPRRWFEFRRWFERSHRNRTCESLMVHRLIADKVAGLVPKGR